MAVIFCLFIFVMLSLEEVKFYIFIKSKLPVFENFTIRGFVSPLRNLCLTLHYKDLLRQQSPTFLVLGTVAPVKT